MYHPRASRLTVWAILVLLLISGLAGLGVVTVAGHAATSTSASNLGVSHSTSVAAPRANGNPDIIVNGGNMTISPASNGGLGYYLMGGNITVENGGSLWIYHENVVFNSYTQTVCGCASDLQRRYWFNDTNYGHVYLVNSTITTNAPGLRAYDKLNLTISGGSTFALTYNSALLFPGNIFVNDSSNLYVNRSTISANPAVPGVVGWPANYTSDNSFGPSILVSYWSNLTTIDSTINGTYKSSFASTNALNENFASSVLPIALPTTWVNTPTIVPSTPLVLDTYNSWSAGAVDIGFSNPTGVPITAEVNLTIYGMTASFPGTTFAAGSHNITLNLSRAFMQSPIDHLNLYTLLRAFESGAGFIRLGGASAPGVTITNLYVSLTPDFQFNVVVYHASSYVAVDSTVNVNWVDPRTVPNWGSNKMVLEDQSTAFLVNSSANSLFSNPYTNVSAFVPDATSNVYIFQWVQARITNPTGSPVVGAQLAALPTTPAATSHNNYTARNFTNSNWLSAGVPQLYSALSYYASHVAGTSTYNMTNAAGVGTIAILTDNLTAYSLPDGVSFGNYNMSLFETAANVTGGPSATISEKLASPKICSWPYGSSCSAPLSLPPAQAPLLIADLQVKGIQFNLWNAAGSTPPAYTENYTISVNVTVLDANSLQLGAPSIPLVLYDNYPGTSGTLPYNQSVASHALTDTDFSSVSSTTITLSMTFTTPQPFWSAGAHMLWAMIDPAHTTTWPSTTGKAVSAKFDVNGVPFSSPSGHGGVYTSMLDQATNQLVTSGSPNTQNTVVLQALVTNIGDAPAAAGSVAVSFQLITPTGVGGSNVATWIGASVLNSGGINSNSGTWLATVTTQVICTCTTLVQAQVTYTPVFPGKNPSPSFTFWDTAPTSVYTVDYTSLVIANNTRTTVPIVVPEVLNANGVLTWAPNANVSIGSLLGIDANMTNVGGPGTQATYWLAMKVVGKSTYWQMLMPRPLSLNTITQWQHLNLSLSWHVNESVINAGGSVAPGQPSQLRTFAIFVNYFNGGANHTVEAPVNVMIWPSSIRFNGVTFSSHSVQEGSTQIFTVDGEVIFNGTGWATIGASLYDPATATNVTYSEWSGLPQARTTNSSAFTNLSVGVYSNANGPLAPGTYNVILYAQYNGGEGWSATPYTITVTAPPAACNEYSQFICPNGSLSTLAFIIIGAVAAVAVLVAAVFLMSKSGKGRLVECGECGELIPEKAPACPKCGAEFEAEMVRCSRCASTIPAKSQVCPECSAILLGKQGAAPDEAQRKDYTQAIERYRSEARKELGENYTEGAFWDWWKRQPSYLSYSAFKLQQTQGTRTGMSAPSAQKTSGEDLYLGGTPPSGGAGGTGVPAPGAPSGGFTAPPSVGHGGVAPAPPAQAAVPGASGAGMKTCSSCQREINADFLVCPFCGAATR